jgi:transcriptional regulator with XRE-family HTH domain
MNDDIPTNLAENLKRLRAQRALSQQALAEKSGVPRPTVAHLETGDANPTLAVVTKLARTLGVGLDDLVAKQTEEISIVEPGERRGEKRAKVRRYDLMPEFVGRNTEFERIVVAPGGRFGVPGSQSSVCLLACEKGELEITSRNEEATLEAERVAVLTTSVECVAPKGAVVYRLNGLILDE